MPEPDFAAVDRLFQSVCDLPEQEREAIRATPQPDQPELAERLRAHPPREPPPTGCTPGPPRHAYEGSHDND